MAVKTQIENTVKIKEKAKALSNLGHIPFSAHFQLQSTIFHNWYQSKSQQIFPKKGENIWCTVISHN